MPAQEHPSELKALLKQVQGLNTLTENQLEELASDARGIHLQRGEFLWNTHDPVVDIFLLIKGFLHVQIQGANGDQIIIGLVPPLSIIGEAEIFSRMPRYLNHMIAVERSSLVAMPKRLFEKLAVENIDFAVYWLQLANLKFLASVQQVYSLKIGSPQVRLARLLLLLNQWRLITGVQVEMPLSHETLGLHVGLSRPVVSTIMSEWKKKGIVSTGYGWIKLEDLNALTQLAGEDQ